MRIVWLTGVAIVSKQRALDGVIDILTRLNVDPELIEVCRRRAPLPEGQPPGAAIAGAA